MIAENQIKEKGIVNAIGNSLLEFILLGKIPLSSKSYTEVKTQSELVLILPMRIISMLVALSGLLAMVFEIKLYPAYSVEIYIIRLTAIESTANRVLDTRALDIQNRYMNH